MRVFGSVARGDADERSDVDLLVDLDEPRPRGFAYFGLSSCTGNRYAGIP